MLLSHTQLLVGKRSVSLVCLYLGSIWLVDTGWMGWGKNASVYKLLVGTGPLFTFSILSYSSFVYILNALFIAKRLIDLDSSMLSYLDD